MAENRGDFIWYELMTTDAGAAADFYAAVVGWTFSGSPYAAPGGQEYGMIGRDDGGYQGGVLTLTPEMCEQSMRPAWLSYLQVADVDATVDATEAEGGRVCMPAKDLPVGRIALVADPQGVPIYVMAPVPPEDDPDAESDVFSPDAVQRVGWNELASPDLDASKAFYAQHFGFEFNEAMPMGEMGDYCFIDHGGRRLGAIMQRQDQGQPAMWLSYFRVPSIAKAKQAVEAGGGTVMAGPVQVPGGDWIIVAADPQGADFGLVGAKESIS